MSLLSDYTDDDMKPQRSLSNLLISELIHNIINEGTCEVEYSLLNKSVLKQCTDDVAGPMNSASEVLYNYKSKLLDIILSEKWFDIYSSRIRQDLIEQLKAAVTEQSNVLNIKVDASQVDNEYTLKHQISALEKSFIDSDERINNDDSTYSQVMKLQKMYEKLPFQ